MRWLCIALLCLSLPLGTRSQGQTVRIGVLGIFHPQQLLLVPDESGGLLVSAGDQQIFLQARSACNLLRIRASNDALLLTCGANEIQSKELRAAGRNQQPVGFLLAVPGKIKRRYEGMFDLKARNGELIPTVTMDFEAAVASVVEAETVPGTPLEGR